MPNQLEIALNSHHVQVWISSIIAHIFGNSWSQSSLKGAQIATSTIRRLYIAFDVIVLGRDSSYGPIRAALAPYSCAAIDLGVS